MSDVVVTQDSNVLEVKFDRPRKKNALTFAMYDRATEALRAAQEDRDVRVVLLAGTGDSFCAGNDIQDFLANTAIDPAGSPPIRFVEALVNLDKLLVVAVHGAAVGIGTTMLLHADFVYASESARFSTPFVGLALVPEAASSLLLPFRVGQAAASEMLLRGTVLEARRAAELGLVNEVAASSDDVLVLARARAHELASKPPSAARLTKSLIRPDSAALLARVKLEAGLFGERLASEEAREAFSAFIERRPADFSRFS
jgi:enoyl-CoA hydratase/carnithine racemase